MRLITADDGSRAQEPAPRPASDDLAGVLRACSRGDEEAFGRLYDAVGGRVFGLVLRVLRDRAQAEEVLQEVFLEIWRTSARYDSAQGSPMTWMLTIAHRRAVDRVRQAESSHTRESIYAARHQEVAYDVTSDAVTRTLDAERVRRAMESLTPVQRQAVELAYFGGYTHTEVARLLDLPLGTAKTRIRDGLIRLRDTMGGTR